MQRQFAKKTESLGDIFDFVAQFAESQAVDARISREMQFAVEEIFTNMVRYNTESVNDVTIGMEIANGDLRVWLADHDVHSYDPNTRPPVDTKQPLNERRPGGLGIHLVREMMDDVLYEYADRTATVTLVKHLGDKRC